MDVSKCIEQRRAIFPAQYIDKPIARETIIQLMNAANWAPSHKKTEPWRFKVLEGAALVRLGNFLAEKYKETCAAEKFSDFKYKKLQNNPTKAGAIIAICMQRDLKERVPEWEEIAATAMAVQNMWLQATALSVGAYWSSPGLIQHMDAFFDLALGERCLGFLYLGYHKESDLQGLRSAVKDKIVWIE